LLLALHPIFVSAFTTTAAPQRQPNLLIILADDLGYGDLSAYGATDIRTPNIDALIASGMRFDNFYANSTVCSPSRAALMTGRYPDLVGVPGVIREDSANSWGYLAPSATLLPQMLKRVGYSTALIGKWHLGLESPNLPNERGFDYFHGFLSDMMDDYYTHLRGGVNFMRENNRAVSPNGHATEIFTQWTIEYLDERKRDSNKPFFLYLAYNAPHVPIQPPAEWLEKVRHRQPDLNPQRLKLAALIEHLDDQIGRIVAGLKANGQYENTLIVFTSDNGGQLNIGASNGNLRGGKEEFYEGGIRVPACAVWSGHIKPQTRSDGIMLLMDLWPTFCEAAGASVKHAIDGVSILPILLGQNLQPRERTLFWMRREGGDFYLGKDYYAVRRGPWKLMQNHPYMPFRLYNLTDDPHEEHNLATENRRVFDELSRALSAHLQQAGAVPWQKPAR
jgi:arylsulfatase A-like enzyme